MLFSREHCDSALTTAKHLQNKRFIKRTEGNPGGVVAVEVCALSRLLPARACLCEGPMSAWRACSPRSTTPTSAWWTL